MNITDGQNFTLYDDSGETFYYRMSLATPLGKCKLQSNRVKKMLHFTIWMNMAVRWCLFIIGLMLIIGTFIKARIIHYLMLPRSKSTSTTIQLDDLILFEQKVNLINGLLIFAQLLRLLFPTSMREILGNTAFCSAWVALVIFALFHRAIGGFGIAVVRQVLLLMLQLWSLSLIL